MDQRLYYPSAVDDISDPADIANLFYNKFRDVYTSVPYNQSDMHKLKKDIDKCICKDFNELSKTGIPFVTADEITKLVNLLKHNKFDGFKWKPYIYFIS